MTLLDAAKALKKSRAGQKTAVESLAARLQKTAGMGRDVASGAADGALMGAGMGGFGGALTGLFSKGGLRGIGFKALTGAAVGAVPSAMYGAYGGYQNHRAKAQALRQYQMNGGYGHEFIRQPGQAY